MNDGDNDNNDVDNPATTSPSPEAEEEMDIVATESDDKRTLLKGQADGTRYETAPAIEAATPTPSPSSSPSCCCIDFSKMSRHGLGVVLILLVAVIWVSSSEFLQYVFGSEDFNKPFFVTYFNTMSFALWMFGFACPDASGFAANPLTRARQRQQHQQQQLSEATAAATSTTTSVVDRPDSLGNVPDPATPAHLKTEMRSSREFGGGGDLYADNANDSSSNTSNTSNSSSNESSRPPPPPYTVAEVAYAAFLFCPLWFLANVLFNYSLSRTSVASNTILSSTSTIWAMLFSRLLLKEPVTTRKLIALSLAFGGAFMVGFGDSSSSKASSMEGNILAGVSAMFYAAYTTVLKYNLPDERRYPIGMCFAFVGVLNALLLWPGLILLNGLGVEPFEWPSATVTGFLVLNGLVGTNLSDILWAKSVVLTSPLIATLGLSLTLPLSILADLVLRGEWHAPLYLCGAGCVLLGFVVANLKDESKEADGGDDGDGDDADAVVDDA